MPWCTHHPFNAQHNLPKSIYNQQNSFGTSISPRDVCNMYLDNSLTSTKRHWFAQFKDNGIKTFHCILPCTNSNDICHGPLMANISYYQVKPPNKHILIPFQQTKLLIGYSSSTSQCTIRKMLKLVSHQLHFSNLDLALDDLPRQRVLLQIKHWRKTYPKLEICSCTYKWKTETILHFSQNQKSS